MLCKSIGINKDIVKSIIIIIFVILICLASLTRCILAGKKSLRLTIIITKIHTVVEAFKERKINIGIEIGKIIVIPVVILHIVCSKRAWLQCSGRERYKLAGRIIRFQQWWHTLNTSPGRFGSIVIYKGSGRLNTDFPPFNGFYLKIGTQGFSFEFIIDDISFLINHCAG